MVLMLAFTLSIFLSARWFTSLFFVPFSTIVAIFLNFLESLCNSSTLKWCHELLIFDLIYSSICSHLSSAVEVSLLSWHCQSSVTEQLYFLYKMFCRKLCQLDCSVLFANGFFMALSFRTKREGRNSRNDVMERLLRSKELSYMLCRTIGRLRRVLVYIKFPFVSRPSSIEYQVISSHPYQERQVVMMVLASITFFKIQEIHINVKAMLFQIELIVLYQLITVHLHERCFSVVRIVEISFRQLFLHFFFIFNCDCVICATTFARLIFQ